LFSFGLCLGVTAIPFLNQSASQLRLQPQSWFCLSLRGWGIFLGAIGWPSVASLNSVFGEELMQLDIWTNASPQSQCRRKNNVSSEIYFDYTGLIAVSFGEQNPGFTDDEWHLCGPSVSDAPSYTEKIFPSELGWKFYARITSMARGQVIHLLLFHNFLGHIPYMMYVACNEYISYFRSLSNLPTRSGGPSCCNLIYASGLGVSR
jgi:hypothetical protein